MIKFTMDFDTDDLVRKLEESAKKAVDKRVREIADERMANALTSLGDEATNVKAEVVKIRDGQYEIRASGFSSEDSRVRFGQLVKGERNERP